MLNVNAAWTQKQQVGLPEGPASFAQPVSAEEDKRWSEKYKFTAMPAGHNYELQTDGWTCWEKQKKKTEKTP